MYSDRTREPRVRDMDTGGFMYKIDKSPMSEKNGYETQCISQPKSGDSITAKIKPARKKSAKYRASKVDALNSKQTVKTHIFDANQIINIKPETNSKSDKADRTYSPKKPISPTKKTAVKQHHDRIEKLEQTPGPVVNRDNQIMQDQHTNARDVNSKLPVFRRHTSKVSPLNATLKVDKKADNIVKNSGDIKGVTQDATESVALMTETVHDDRNIRPHVLLPTVKLSTSLKKSVLKKKFKIMCQNDRMLQHMNGTAMRTRLHTLTPIDETIEQEHVKQTDITTSCDLHINEEKHAVDGAVIPYNGNDELHHNQATLPTDLASVNQCDSLEQVRLIFIVYLCLYIMSKSFVSLRKSITVV